MINGTVIYDAVIYKNGGAVVLKIEIEVDEIDYAGIAEKMHGTIRKEAETGRNMPAGVKIIAGMPTGLVRGAVNVMPESTKESIAVYLLDKYKEDLKNEAEKFAEDSGFKLKVKNINVYGANDR